MSVHSVSQNNSILSIYFIIFSINLKKTPHCSWYINDSTQTAQTRAPSQTTADDVLQRADDDVGGGVRTGGVHLPTPEVRVGREPQPHREPDQNMVPEPQSQGKTDREGTTRPSNQVCLISCWETYCVVKPSKLNGFRCF